MNELVLVRKQNHEEVPVTTSKVIAENTENKHHSITKLIQTYENDFKEFGILRFEIEEIKGRGQPEKLFFLNEQQSTLLITYLRNSEKVRRFKIELVKQFFAMRQVLMQKATHEWQQARTQGKEFQKELNDTIKEFVEYATSQGSKNAGFYYSNFAKFANKSVDITGGQRDYSEQRKLTAQTYVIELIKRTLLEEMAKGIPYKEIYKKCQEQVNGLLSYIQPLKLLA